MRKALALLLLLALPASAGMRLGAAPVERAPALAPTLAAPLLPGAAAAPALAATPALSLSLPAPAAPAVRPSAAAVAAVAAARPGAAPAAATEALPADAPAAPSAARGALAEAAAELGKAGPGAEAPVLERLFSGAAAPANAARGPELAAETGRRLAPAFAEEAAATARLMAGRTLTEAETADVTRRTRVVHVGLWKTLFNEFGVMASYPDGVARDDLSIELTRKRPEKLPDEEAYYRALFAHEYTHRLQYEGDVSRRYGVEAAPVAVELLRGIELAGLDGLRAGRIPFITENVLANFDSGAAWARGARTDETVFLYKGALAGAAWALAGATGRPADAWEFVRRVASQRAPEAPGAVFAEIAARPKR